MKVKFAEKVKEFRTELNLSQEKLAKILGTTQPTVNRWEKGDSRPSYEMLGELKRLFKVSTDELLGFDDF